MAINNNLKYIVSGLPTGTQQNPVDPRKCYT